MADYRQSCETPGCDYTGFSGHSDFCPKSRAYAQWRAKEQRRQTLEAQDFQVLLNGDIMCNYCGCQVINVDLHRRNSCP